jgi:glycosyltransferase involved in cell wall biosynthesis
VIEVILPALNEAEALPGVLAAMRPGYVPLVVDNGSTDATARIARDHGARVVHEPRRGFGAACFTGLSAARSELVCFMDCDGSLDPRDLESVVGPVRADEADLVLGARHADRTAWPFHLRVANRTLCAALGRRTGVRLADLGPMRAGRRSALLDLGIVDRRFGWPLEMVLRAARGGWRVAEVPVTYRRRVGRSKVTGTLRGTMRAAWDMGAVLR